VLMVKYGAGVGFFQKDEKSHVTFWRGVRFDSCKGRCRATAKRQIVIYRD
jgi:hypothetical protein